MKIIVAIDSFKDCLSSEAAGEAARKGVLEALPSASVTVLPIADGGEGSAATLLHYLGGVFCHALVPDPLGRNINAGFILNGDTAIVELARTSGLTLLKEYERNVANTTTYGFGRLISIAIEKGAKRIICTLGGSATNDLGLGALQALGLKVFDKFGEILTPVSGKDLSRITHFDATLLNQAVENISFSYLYDADIDFYGPYGAACMYARQKGADDETVTMLDRAAKHISSLEPFPDTLNKRHIPGAGAAGATGASLVAFLNATPISGIEAILTAAQFDKHIRDADLVITGEGCADAQTRQGKAAAGILRHSEMAGVPVILIAGRIKDYSSLLEDGYAAVININDSALCDAFNEESDADPLNASVASRRITNALSDPELLLSAISATK